MKKMLLLALSLIIAALVPAQTTKISVPLRFDHYYTLDQVYEAVQALNKAYPEMTKLEEVGKSEEGRPIYALTVNSPKTGPDLAKPAIYVDGNMHGNEIQGGEVCLYLLDYLLGNYGKNKEVTELLDKSSTWSRSLTWTAAITFSMMPTRPAPTGACASQSTTIETAWWTRTSPTTSIATATSA